MSTKRFAEEFRRILGNRRGGGNREGNPKGGVSDVRNPWIPMNFHDLWGFDTCRDPCRCQKPTRTPRRIPGIILGQALLFPYKNEMDFQSFLFKIPSRFSGGRIFVDETAALHFHVSTFYTWQGFTPGRVLHLAGFPQQATPLKKRSPPT